MMKKVIIPFFILIMVGCKSSLPSIVTSESFTDEDFLDSLVTKWESSNSIYLNGLRDLEKDDNEILHIENIIKYSVRATEGFEQYEARREGFLRFLFSNYDMKNKDFIISENFQGEKIFYIVVFGNKKVTFQKLAENWREIKSESVSDFKDLAENIRVFKRDPNCSLRTFSFSLFTLFEKESILTKLDDKSCQTPAGARVNARLVFNGYRTE